MHTAVGKITIHTIDLCQVAGAAYRADIHLKLLMTAVVTICQRKVDSLIISEIHCSANQCPDGFFIVTDRITYILDLTTITEFPETSFQIMLLDRSHILCYMAVETVAHIRSVGYTLYDSVHLAELLNLQTAETLSRCAVDCIEVTILLLELVYLVVDIFQYFQRELTVLTDRFAIVKLLQLIQCCNTEAVIGFRSLPIFSFGFRCPP